MKGKDTRIYRKTGRRPGNFSGAPEGKYFFRRAAPVTGWRRPDATGIRSLLLRVVINAAGSVAQDAAGMKIPLLPVKKHLVKTQRKTVEKAAEAKSI